MKVVFNFFLFLPCCWTEDTVLASSKESLRYYCVNVHRAKSFNFKHWHSLPGDFLGQDSSAQRAELMFIDGFSSVFLPFLSRFSHSQIPVY